MQVTDPDGVEWEVSRRWLELPRWSSRRVRKFADSYGPLWTDEELGVALAIVALVIVFYVVGIPVLLFLVAVVFALLGLVARILFGRPWLVEAKSERGELQWRVRGTRGSRRAMAEIAAALRRGDRTYSPPHAQRLLPESPISAGERTSSVRVQRRRG